MNHIFSSSRISGVSLTGILIKGLVLLGLFYLIVMSSYTEGALNPILLSGLLILFLFTKPRGDLGIEIPSLLFLLVLILTSITSIDPRRSFYEVWLIGIGIFLIYVTARIVRLGFSSRTMVNFLLLIGLGFMIFSWLDASKWYSTWRSSYPGEWIPGISYRLNGGNTIAAYYHGILMIGVARFVTSKSRWERLSMGAYCFSAALLIFLSSSRGAYLAVIGGFCVLIVLQWSRLKKWIPILQNLFKRFRVLILGAGLIALLVLVAFTTWYIQNMQSHPTHVASLQSRNEFWEPAFKAILRSPWIGNGPYTYAIDFMQVTSIPPRDIFLHAHNMYLDILSGSGLVGFLVSAWLMGTLILRLWRSFHSEQQTTSFVVLGALLVLSSFLVHSIFDGLYLMPFAALNICVLIGSALGELKATQRKFSLIPMGLGIGITALAWVNLWLTKPYLDGLEAASAGDFRLAAEQFNLSTQRDPGLVLTYQQLGLAESILASEGDQTALERAIQAMEETVRLDPAYSPNHANLAGLYRANGQLDLAKEEFQQAIALAPRWPILVVNLGETYETQGNWSIAAEAYEQVLSLKPEWFADGFWTETAFRREFLSEWLEENSDTSVEEIQYTEEEITHQASARLILNLAAKKISDQEIRAAKRLLGVAQIAFFSYPDQRLELIWLNAEIAAASENWPEAISLGEEALDGFRLQGTYGPGSVGKTLYGTGVFHLRMMEVELIPQLTLIYLPDPWPQRMLKLAKWYTMNEDLLNCNSTLDELLQYIPDFAERHSELQLDCTLLR
jgi:putative inorganic carbon (HCO3(-)) transporter